MFRDSEEREGRAVIPHDDTPSKLARGASRAQPLSMLGHVAQLLVHHCVRCGAFLLARLLYSSSVVRFSSCMNKQLEFDVKCKLRLDFLSATRIRIAGCTVRLLRIVVAGQGSGLPSLRA